jgi:hypothetical protein
MEIAGIYFRKVHPSRQPSVYPAEMAYSLVPKFESIHSLNDPNDSIEAQN